MDVILAQYFSAQQSAENAPHAELDGVFQFVGVKCLLKSVT